VQKTKLLRAPKKKPASKRTTQPADSDLEGGSDEDKESSVEDNDGSVEDEDEEDAEESEEEDEESEEEEEEEVIALYTKMWYKNNNCFGIRQKNPPKKQIASIGGKRCKLDKTMMGKIADHCILKMSKGEIAESDLVAEIQTLMVTTDAD
jgi:hypothetical protein